MRSRPTSRSTRWPARPRPTASPAIRRSARTSTARSTCSTSYYLDYEQGGYFSHIDPVTFDPQAESLGRNRARKNWNSVGDHAPAYLINLLLATGEPEHVEMLDRHLDTIATHFPDYDNSPFVQEKFHEDWSAGPRRGAGSRTAASSGTT